MQTNFDKDSLATLSYTHPLKKQCTKFLSRHQPVSPLQSLQSMANSKYSCFEQDFYGEGKLVQMLEERMAELLGKPNALFCHKGMVGQLSALKYWTQKNGNNRIGFQPDCHMDFDEQSAYRELLGLEAVKIGSNSRPLAPEDFLLKDDVSVVSIELPHRRAGFLLPEWQTLVDLKNHCKQTSTTLHFDGARLFESAPYWHKSPADVSALCDSVYVSLYKLFGALAGGIVAADEDTIEAIRPWKSRMGGDVHTLFPYAISAMMGLDHYLPRITEFVDKASHLAGIFSRVFGKEALPFKPQSNNFIVHIPLSPEELSAKALGIAEKEKRWLFDAIYPLPNNHSKVEIQIGDALDFWNEKEVKACFEQLM